MTENAENSALPNQPVSPMSNMPPEMHDDMDECAQPPQEPDDAFIDETLRRATESSKMNEAEQARRVEMARDFSEAAHVSLQIGQLSFRILDRILESSPVNMADMTDEQMNQFARKSTKLMGLILQKYHDEGAEFCARHNLPGPMVSARKTLEKILAGVEIENGGVGIGGVETGFAVIAGM